MARKIVFKQGNVVFKDAEDNIFNVEDIFTGDKIIPHPILSNNYFVADQYGHYNHMVKIPKAKWTQAAGLQAIDRPASLGDTIAAINSTAITLHANAQTAAAILGNNAYVGAYMYVGSEKRIITAYDQVNNVATVDIAFASANVGDLYSISATHPAWIVNQTVANSVGSEVDDSGDKGWYIGKYIARCINTAGVQQNYAATYNTDWLANSWALKPPQTNINYDEAVNACALMNAGGDLLNTTGKFFMQPNALWAYLALWSKENGTMPFGNNNYGQDIDDPTVNGFQSNDSFVRGTSGTCRSLGGSGGVYTSHNHQEDGVFDMNGNVWELASGVKLGNDADTTQDESTKGLWFVHGDKNNGAAYAGCSVEADEQQWLNSEVYSGDHSGGVVFSSVTPRQSWNGSVLASHKRLNELQALGVIPDQVSNSAAYGEDNYWSKQPSNNVTNQNMSIALRGSSWTNGVRAGVFALNLNHGRLLRSIGIGFRPAFLKI